MWLVDCVLGVHFRLVRGGVGGGVNIVLAFFRASLIDWGRFYIFV